ncbi:uncharacterized protein LOC124495763 isoform X2 [Dermatophagoides farinae]|uniref:uncharacterized protein LOC124495763 isoform X2 n=1 Tax=Dermatophagoides farinae TaxID=6954 RepID=UPI003F6423E3
MEIFKFYSYGILSNIICFFGLLGNTLTLYILNSSKDMRKSTINIYLTVLTLYDNGVLIFSVLMLNIPAINDYQLQQQQQQILAAAAATSAATTTTNEFISFMDDPNRLGEPPPSPPPPIPLSSSSQSRNQIINDDSSAIIINNNNNSNTSMSLMNVMMMTQSPSLNGDNDDDMPLMMNQQMMNKIGTTLSVPTLLSEKNIKYPLPSSSSSSSSSSSLPFKHRHTHQYDDSIISWNHALNDSFIAFINQCLLSVDQSTTTKDDHSSNNDDDYRSQFDWQYCRLLFRLNSYTMISDPLFMEEIEENSDESSIELSSQQNNILIPWSNRMQPNRICLHLMNKTLNIMDHFDNAKIVPDHLWLEKHLQILLSLTNNITTIVDDDQRFCNWNFIVDDVVDSNATNGCPFMIEMPFSPLVYYVKIVYPLALIAQTGSIWTTCLITIERYLAVCHPLMTMTLSTRARAIWALSILSIMAFLFNLPRFAEVDTTCNQVRATEFRHNKIYYQVYYIFLNLTFNYIVPLSLLAALNVKIYFSVQKASQNRNELTRARQSELHLASMFIAIVAIFIACNAPAFIVNCLEPYFQVGTPVLELMTIFSNVLVCFNSSINFVIYCIFGRKFRLKFLRLLRLNRWKFCNRRQYRSSSTSAAAAASSCSGRTVTIPFNRHHGGAMMMMMNRGDSTILNGPNNENINNNNQHNHQKSNWSSMVEGQLKIEQQQQQQQTKLQPQQQPTPPPMTMENVRFSPSSIIRSNTFGSYSNQTIHTMNNQHHNDDDDDDEGEEEEKISMVNHYHFNNAADTCENSIKTTTTTTNRIKLLKKLSSSSSPSMKSLHHSEEKEEESNLLSMVNNHNHHQTFDNDNQLNDDDTCV